MIDVVANSASRAAELDSMVMAALKGYAVSRLVLGKVLIEVFTSGSYLTLGYPSMEAYVEDRMARTERWWNYLRVETEKRLAIPVLDQALTTGKMTSTAARCLLPLLTRENASRLMKNCLGRSDAEIKLIAKGEREAKGWRRAPAGVRTGGMTLRVSLSPTQADQYRLAVARYRTKLPGSNIGVIIGAICQAAVK